MVSNYLWIGGKVGSHKVLIFKRTNQSQFFHFKISVQADVFLTISLFENKILNWLHDFMTSTESYNDF